MPTDLSHLARLRKMLSQVNPDNEAMELEKTLESQLEFPSPKTQLEARRFDSRTSKDLDASEFRTLENEKALESLDLLVRGRDDQIDAEGRFTLEAIVMPYHRPVVDIVNNRMQVEQLTPTWTGLSDASVRPKLEECFHSVGRINVPNILYAGSGFVVGDGLLMTNRHVASMFAMGVGTRNVRFQPGLSAEVDFYHENGNDQSDSLTVEDVVMIHPYWDMALVKVKGLPEHRKPLQLCAEDPANLVDRSVVVVGYPGYDPNGDDEFRSIQNRIFRSTYYVKRLQPGILRNRERVTSFQNVVDAITHDCSTLGGNSGSAAILVPDSPDEPAQVIGLHFAGRYLAANYAVPAYDLAQDPRMIDSGVNFAVPVPNPRPALYDPIWQRADHPDESSSKGSAESNAGSAVAISSGESGSGKTVGSNSGAQGRGNTQHWTIPLHVSISIGDATIPTPHISVAPPSQTADAEAEWLFSRKPTFPKPTIDDFSLASLAKKSFDWQAALSTALASSVAYEDRTIVMNACQQNWEFDSCEFYDIDTTQCFVAVSDGVTLVSFRGTKELHDWLANLNVISTTRDYGQVHRGFLGAFQVVESLLRNAIKHAGSHPLVLTGHSLGGALATVAAAEWKDVFPIRMIYTFGQPAVGKGDFVDHIKQNYSNQFFRFVNDDDIVPMVPPTYRHVGRLMHLDPNGNVKPRREALESAANDRTDTMSEVEFDRFRLSLLNSSLQQQALRNESLDPVTPTQEGLLPSVGDHSLTGYLGKIAARAGL